MGTAQRTRSKSPITQLCWMCAPGAPCRRCKADLVVLAQRLALFTARVRILRGCAGGGRLQPPSTLCRLDIHARHDDVVAGMQPMVSGAVMGLLGGVWRGSRRRKARHSASFKAQRRAHPAQATLRRWRNYRWQIKRRHSFDDFAMRGSSMPLMGRIRSGAMLASPQIVPEAPRVIALASRRSSPIRMCSSL